MAANSCPGGSVSRHERKHAGLGAGNTSESPHWSELKKLLGGKKVTLQLAEGGRVEGRVRKVTDTSLVFNVKKSSEPANYPKGTLRISRESVSRIEVRGLKENSAMRVARVAATAGTFVGTLFTSLVVAHATGSDSGERLVKVWQL